MYAVDGGRQLPERELDHLPGYEGSRPVRIGNGAVGQRQTDVLGEVMIALEDARTPASTRRRRRWALQRSLVDELAEHWDEPDNGLWEIRGELRHFTHSRVMVWVAFDRAVRAVEEHGLPARSSGGASCATQVRDEVLDKRLRRASATRSPSTTTPPRSTRACSTSRWWASCPATTSGCSAPSARSRRTCCATASCCATAPRAASTAWPATSTRSWPARSGWSRPTPWPGASTTPTRSWTGSCALANDVGLLSEEYDVDDDRMAGNFPQAFSHLTLVQAAFAPAPKRRTTGRPQSSRVSAAVAPAARRRRPWPRRRDGWRRCRGSVDVIARTSWRRQPRLHRRRTLARRRRSGSSPSRDRPPCRRDRPVASPSPRLDCDRRPGVCSTLTRCGSTIALMAAHRRRAGRRPAGRARRPPGCGRRRGTASGS